MTHYLGFDVGTQSTKALLLDGVSHQVVARAQRSHELLGGLPQGAAEQHPDSWIEAVAATAREVLAGVDPATVGGVGVSGQQHGLVVLDAEDRVVRPAKLWCDTSTNSEARELSEQLGRAVPTGFTASKLLWLQRHEPENWQRVRSVLLPHDYVNFRLTGQKTMECGDASGTGFFDVAARTFDSDAVAAISPQLAGMLPPLVAAGEPAGRLDASGAAMLGLPAGLPVAAGGGDNMMAAIGSGATRAGVVVASLGTSATVFTRTEAPAFDPDGLIAPFCSSDGAWLPLLCLMNATGVTEEVRSAYGIGHDELTRLATAEPMGNGGMLWVPFLAGERVPDLPEATGSLLGMRAGCLRPGAVYRAALEGVSCNLALGVARMRALGIEPRQLRLVGGAARNPLWQQLLADLLDVEVVPLVEQEAAALGAAIAAKWTASGGVAQGSSDEIASPCLALRDPVRPRPEHAAAARELLTRFSAALSSHLG